MKYTLTKRERENLKKFFSAALMIFFFVKTHVNVDFVEKFYEKTPDEHYKIRRGLNGGT